MNHCKHFHFDGVMHTPCPQCEIDHLRAENELLKAKLTRSTTRVELLENAIDNAMVVSHIGVFSSGDDPRIAINKLACHEQDVGAFFAIEKIKEQGPICYWDGCYSDPYFRAKHNAPGIGKDGIPSISWANRRHIINGSSY